MRGDLMERRNQVEQGKHPSFAQGVRNQARDEQLLILLSILSLIVIRTPPDFFRITTSGFEYGEVECWIRPTARYWFKVTSTSLAMIGLILWGRAARATFRGRNLERHQGARTKIRLGLGENVNKIAKTITQLFDCQRGPARAVKIECNRLQMWRQSFPDAK